VSFAPYPKYVQSGNQSIGALPAHWRLSRLCFVSWVRARLGWKGLKADEYVDDGFVLLSTPDIKGRSIDFSNVNFINRERFDESPEIKLRVGDVLLAKDGSTLGTVNVVRHLPREATVNSSIAVITPGDALDGIFLHYVFQASFMQQTIAAMKGGMGVPHLFQADINKFYLPIPTLAEQRAIAAFLDRETAKIDALVSEQRRLMDLLREQRQAVISHAVTKGLNPGAPVKDSGVEWLGEVPAHWAVTPLARATSDRCDGPFGSGLKSEHYTESGVRVIRLQNIKRTGFDDSDAAFIDPAYYAESLRGHDVVAGDLLIAGLGDDNNVVGRACVALEGIEPAMVKADCFRFRLNGRHAVPDFVAHQLNASAAVDAGRLSTGTTRSRIPLSVMGNRRIALPPLDEQMAVTSFLAEHIAATAKLGEQVLRAAGLLEERRAALITAAVTGQIDVRGLALSEAA
jgi:type I restriction enzyme S subunit